MHVTTRKLTTKDAMRIVSKLRKIPCKATVSADVKGTSWVIDAKSILGMIALAADAAQLDFEFSEFSDVHTYEKIAEIMGKYSK